MGLNAKADLSLLIVIFLATLTVSCGMKRVECLQIEGGQAVNAPLLLMVPIRAIYLSWSQLF